VFEGNIRQGERSNVYAGELNVVPIALRLPPRRDDAAAAGQSATQPFAERIVTTLIRALAAWPA
jgi:hypothetical protein